MNEQKKQEGEALREVALNIAQEHASDKRAFIVIAVDLKNMDMAAMGSTLPQAIAESIVSAFHHRTMMSKLESILGPLDSDDDCVNPDCPIHGQSSKETKEAN